MGEENAEGVPASVKRADVLYEKLAGYVTKTVKNFVAFIFILLALGILFGAMIALKHPKFVATAVVATAMMGFIAYYNRAFATVLFFALLGIAIAF